MRQLAKSTKRGDTLIEVMLSISIFAMIALLSVNMMNNGINTAQRTLETQMARNEIDAQAEAIRFIHDNYVAEFGNANNDNRYRDIWKTLVNNAIKPSRTVDNTDAGGSTTHYFDINNMDSCNDVYTNNSRLKEYHSFVVNPRLLLPDYPNRNGARFTYSGIAYSELINHAIVGESKMQRTSIYPRMIYKKLSGAGNTDNQLDEGMARYDDIQAAEGIWIDVVGNNETNPAKSDYYDFYIRTCWQGSGMHTQSTITTVVRLYNPEVMQ